MLNVIKFFCESISLLHYPPPPSLSSTNLFPFSPSPSLFLHHPGPSSFLPSCSTSCKSEVTCFFKTFNPAHTIGIQKYIFIEDFLITIVKYSFTFETVLHNSRYTLHTKSSPASGKHIVFFIPPFRYHTFIGMRWQQYGAKGTTHLRVHTYIATLTERVQTKKYTKNCTYLLLSIHALSFSSMAYLIIRHEVGVLQTGLKNICCTLWTKVRKYNLLDNVIYLKQGYFNFQIISSHVHLHMSSFMLIVMYAFIMIVMSSPLKSIHIEILLGRNGYNS